MQRPLDVYSVLSQMCYSPFSAVFNSTLLEVRPVHRKLNLSLSATYFEMIVMNFLFGQI